MNAFQLATLGLLASLAVFTATATARGFLRKRFGAFWLLTWIATAITVVWPESTVRMAHALGIGRGADLVSYCTTLGVLVGFFWMYTRMRRLDRQMTLLVRELAVRNPLMSVDSTDPSATDASTGSVK